MAMTPITYIVPQKGTPSMVRNPPRRASCFTIERVLEHIGNMNHAAFQRNPPDQCIRTPI